MDNVWTLRVQLICFTHIIVFCPTVLTEGGQVRGGDQGPHRQAEGGKVFTRPLSGVQDH